MSHKRGNKIEAIKIKMILSTRINVTNRLKICQESLHSKCFTVQFSCTDFLLDAYCSSFHQKKHVGYAGFKLV